MSKTREKIFMVTNQKFIWDNLLSIYEFMDIIDYSDDCEHYCDDDFGSFESLSGSSRREFDKLC